MTLDRTSGRTSRTVKTTLATAAVVIAAAGLLTSCSSSGSKAPSGGSSTTASASGGSTVNVKNFAFSPSSLSVAKGTTVTWKFDDSANHNVTDSKKTFASKDLHTGGSYSFKFNTAGTYSYICTIHQYMKGSVTVK